LRLEFLSFRWPSVDGRFPLSVVSSALVRAHTFAYGSPTCQEAPRFFFRLTPSGPLAFSAVSSFLPPKGALNREGFFPPVFPSSPQQLAGGSHCTVSSMGPFFRALFRDARAGRWGAIFSLLSYPGRGECWTPGPAFYSVLARFTLVLSAFCNPSSLSPFNDRSDAHLFFVARTSFLLSRVKMGGPPPPPPPDRRLLPPPFFSFVCRRFYVCEFPL